MGKTQAQTASELAVAAAAAPALITYACCLHGSRGGPPPLVDPDGAAARRERGPSNHGAPGRQGPRLARSRRAPII